MGEKTYRVRRTLILFFSTMLFSLEALAGPDERLRLDPSDLYGPTAGDGSRQNPFIVKRDNPAVGGELNITDTTVEAQVSSKFLSDGTWKNFSGHFKFREYRDHGWRRLMA